MTLTTDELRILNFVVQRVTTPGEANYILVKRIRASLLTMRKRTPPGDRHRNDCDGG